jgi:hypothetical protein
MRIDVEGFSKRFGEIAALSRDLAIFPDCCQDHRGTGRVG